MVDYDISAAFQRIEEEMIASMSRNMSRHLRKEVMEGINYTMWQAEQLAALNRFRKDNAALFEDYFSTVNKEIERLLREAHRSGSMEQEEKILSALKKGFKVPRSATTDALQGDFFQINERKLNALIEATVGDMKKAETAMLRMANDEYRKAIFNAEVYYNTGAGTLPECVDMATQDFLSRGIRCIEYANGARVGIDSYAQMALRTAETRAYLYGEASKRDEWGVSTVIVGRRGVACPRCLNFVGCVFYDDVWGNAPIPFPRKYPLLSEAIDGGLYHPNCKDIHTTYFEGVSTPPKPLTEEEKREASRVYDLEQQQRYNERQIRKYKRLSQGSVDPENRERHQKKLAAWQERQRDFVKENSDVLKRRYENEKLRIPGAPELAKIADIAKDSKGLAAKIGGDGIPEHDEPILFKTIDYNDKKSVLDTLTDFEKSAIMSDVETACVITKNGKVYKCFGVEGNVYPDFDLGDELIGAIVTHNHPIDVTEYTFSNEDFRLFQRYHLEVLRGCDEKYTYEFTRDATQIDEIPEEWMTEENFEHGRRTVFARENGIGYRRWKNDEGGSE